MNYYMVMDNRMNYRGYTIDKKEADKFLSQRTEGNYLIEVIETNKKNKRLIESLKNSYDEMVCVEGFMLFPAEEEYLYGAFDQTIIEIQCALLNIIREVIPYLQLEKDERKTVDKYLYAMYNHLEKYSLGGTPEEAEDALFDGKDLLFEKFDFMLMAKQIVKDFD